MRILGLVLILGIVGCNNVNLEINTSDPQASGSIRDSKEDNFFIQEYCLEESADTFINVKESWLEYSWMNKISNSQKIKVRTTGFQLNFKIMSFNLPNIKGSRYFIDWRMKAQNIGILGTGNGVYTLDIGNEIIPDSFRLQIERRIDNEYVPYKSFMIYALEMMCNSFFKCSVKGLSSAKVGNNFDSPMQSLQGLSMVLLTCLIFLAGCAEHKPTHRNTTKVCDNLYVESYLIFGSGAYGGDIVSEYLTDSSNFRIIVGKFDNYDEAYSYKCKNDSVFIERFKTSHVDSNMAVLERKKYSLDSLRREHKFETIQ